MNLKSQGSSVKKVGRPKVDTEQVSVRIETSVLNEIDDLRKMESDLPSRPAMVRRIIDRYLAAKKKRE